MTKLVYTPLVKDFVLHWLMDNVDQNSKDGTQAASSSFIFKTTTWNSKNGLWSVYHSQQTDSLIITCFDPEKEQLLGKMLNAA